MTDIELPVLSDESQYKGTPTEYIGHDPVEVALRQSNVADFQSCPRKFMLRHRYQLRKKTKGRSRALDIGTFWHLFMGRHYLGESPDAALVEINEFIAKVVEEAEEEVDDNGMVSGGQSLSQLCRTMEQNKMMAKMMAEVYISYFPFNQEAYDLRGAERTIRARQPGLPAKLEGTLDLEWYDKKNNGIWIVDHKTEGARGSAVDRVLAASFELQPRLYRMLASGVHGDTPILGFIHQVIQKPTIDFCDNDRDCEVVPWVPKSGPRKGMNLTKKKYTGEPKYSNYVKRCKDWYLGEGDYAEEKEKREKHPPFIQSRVHFTGPIMPRELYNQLYPAAVAATNEPNLDECYRKSSACRAYGRVCEYMALCKSAPSGWKAIIEHPTKGYERRERD